MAQDTSGIMGLQEDYFSKGMLPPEMGLEVADGTMKNLDPNLLAATDGLTSEISGKLAELSDEELDIFIQLVQQLYDEPENYAENRANLIKGGDLTEEDLPTDYQPEALAMILYVLRKEKQTRSGGMSPQPPSSMPPMAGAAPAEMQPPQGFARGGIAEAARIVAGSGRNGDTMLAHITPREAKLLRKHGGSGTINPATGLPEYGLFSFLRDIWQAVWKPVKSFLNTTVGKVVSRIALNVILPGYGEIIYAGLQGAAQDKSFGDIVKNMAIAGVTQYLGGQIPGVQSPIKGITDTLGQAVGITSEVGKNALLQGVVNTGAGLVQGQNLKDAATSGLMAAGTVVASDYVKNALTPQGKYNPETGRVEGNRVIGEPTNVMQDKMGVGAAPIEDMGTYPPPTNASSYTSGNPAATTSSSVSPPVTATSTTGGVPVANAQTSTVGPYKPVSVGDAFSTMGQGAKQIMGGEFSKGAETFGTGAKDLFMPPSPTADQLSMRQNELMKSNPNLSATQAMDLAKGEAPGIMRTYGPAAAAGLGIMAMAGGFDTPGAGGNPNGPQFRGPTGEDLLKSNPNKYLVQNLPGVQYDAQGNIIGAKEQYPYFKMPDIQVASNYTNAPRFADGGPVMPADSEMNQYAGGGIAYLAAGGPTTLPLSGGVANLSLANIPVGMTAEEFKKKEEERKRKAGIAALATGGYPRQTGHISGPGTEISDSVPAMLSDGEFVMTARAVRGLGKGDRREGAKKMYALMHQLERNAARG